VAKLARSRSWRLVHLDRAASVFFYAAAEPIEDIDIDLRAAELLVEADTSKALPSWLLPRRRLYPALNLALFLRTVGCPDLALKEADALWRAEPDVRLATFTAAAAEEAADLPLAIPRLRWALEASRDDPAVRSWLARALYVRAIAALEEGRVEKARNDLSEVLELSPDQPGALLAQARIEAAEGRIEAAERLLCRAIAVANDGEARRVAEADPLLAPLLPCGE
jgi:tetratricopeptide (TPR) repeat protein